jgi:hypothetical protein
LPRICENISYQEIMDGEKKKIRKLIEIVDVQVIWRISIG